jgi:WD40 repeat protein/serine/threonine protein kinase
MSQEPEASPPAPGGGNPGESAEGRSGGRSGSPGDAPHVSFVQRLRRHFGQTVDPEINLQSQTEEGPGRTGELGSSHVDDFVKRLSNNPELGARFRILGQVAAGGMGTILRVWDEDLRRNLAMKVMHGRGRGASEPGSSSGSPPVDPERLGRFLEEAQITGQLDHPGVVPVHDLGIDSAGRCHFTMRFVRGRELKEVLDLAREAREGWTRTKVLGVILKVCEAMAYAHSKGVVHRDLKPANIMVGRFGETYVMDWGLARVLGRHDSHDLRLKPRPEDASAMSLVRTVRQDESMSNPDSPLVTMDGDVIGTPSYMAPEQARGRLEEVGPRSDVYSLGSILYYMLTGETPYVKKGERVSPHVVLTRVLEGPPVSVEKLAPQEPAELLAICAKAMAREPEDRYASMLEVADDIQAFLENRVVRAYERGSLAEFKKWVVRNRGMAAGIAGMVLLSIASALGFARQQQLRADELSIKENETARAKERAEAEEVRAKASEDQARKNLELANLKRHEADEQAERARQSAELAKRSGYVANLMAASFSLRLGDLGEARERLREAEFDLRGWEWRHLDLRANNATLARVCNFSGVEALAFHPRANRAIVLTGQGKVYIRDLATLEDVPPHDIQLITDVTADSLLNIFSDLGMSINPEGTLVALVGRNNGVQVFDLDTGEAQPGEEGGVLAEHAMRTSAVAFSPNGRTLATGDDGGEIFLRDTLTWEVRARLLGHVGSLTCLGWSADSTRLASGARDGGLRIWDVESGQEIRLLRGHRGAVTGCVWDADGVELYSCGEDGSVNQWDVRDGRLLRTFSGHEGPVRSIDYDPESERLVTGSDDLTARVWNVRSGRVDVLRAHVSPVRDVAFSPGGDLVMTSEAEGTAYLWDAEGDLAVTDLEYHRSRVNGVAFDPTGSTLASASDDGDVLLWRVETGEPLRRLRDHQDPVTAVVYTPDGRSVLTASRDRSMILWDAETGSVQKIYTGFDKGLEGAVFSDDGSRIYAGGYDRLVHVVDARTTEILRRYEGLRYPAQGVALSPDGRYLAARGRRDALVWDLELPPDAPPVQTLSGRFSAMAFAPDGKTLATGTYGGSIGGLVQLWDVENGGLIATQQHHDSATQIQCLCFSPDGSRLFCGTSSGELQVRDGRTADALLVLEEPGTNLMSLAVSPDGLRVAAGLADGRVRLWETTPAAERHEARRSSIQLRKEASALVERLFADSFRVGEVVLQIEGDRDLPRPLKETALRMVHLRGDDPVPLFARTLAECLDADLDERDFQRALERARSAALIVGDDSTGPVLGPLRDLALGMASYRSGRFAEAENYLAVEPPDLRKPRVRRLEYSEREDALRLLFLCLAQCQLARGSVAEQTWRRAQQAVLGDAELSVRTELLDLLAEAETTVRSRAPSGG